MELSDILYFLVEWYKRKFDKKEIGLDDTKKIADLINLELDNLYQLIDEKLYNAIKSSDGDGFVEVLRDILDNPDIDSWDKLRKIVELSDLIELFLEEVNDE